MDQRLLEEPRCPDDDDPIFSFSPYFDFWVEEVRNTSITGIDGICPDASWNDVRLSSIAEAYRRQEWFANMRLNVRIAQRDGVRKTR
jgi:hypothetical protein